MTKKKTTEIGPKAWDGIIRMPYAGRTAKPRADGLTMVIDRGVGLGAMRDLLESAGDYIDIVKLTFGTSAFYDREVLIRKNQEILDHGIDIMPGGTFLEVAVWQGVLDGYLNRAQELGFSAIEVSDGIVEISRKVRAEIIKKSLDRGFKVITEVGKKDPKIVLPIALVHQLIKEDTRNGAFKIIIEAREAGKGVGIFDENGLTRDSEIANILAGVPDPSALIWEAPLRNQHRDLIQRFGLNVSLGNIPPEEVLALEALRQGVRGDTLRRAYLDSKK